MADRLGAAADSKGDLRSILLQGDCFAVLRELDAESVDAVICDPPYGIRVNSEAWDGQHIVDAAASFGAQELTPNEAFGVWCRRWASECRRVMKPGAFLAAFGSPRTYHRLACGLEDSGLEIRDTLMWLYSDGVLKSRRYSGGRAAALKPAFEPIALARRELDGSTEGTIARHGTGALNTEGCRVEGRHPANVILEHAAECEEGACAPGCTAAAVETSAAERRVRPAPTRFLYCPRASRSEREAGCDQLPQTTLDLFPQAGLTRTGLHNPHPTVKPLELMRWLVRLLCPAGGLVLDPTAGSGTTGAAAAIEGRAFIGIECEHAYIDVAAARIAHHAPEGSEGPEVHRVPLGRRR